MRVAILSPYLPHRHVGHGGGVSIRNMVLHLGRLHQITLISLLRPGEEGRDAEVSADLGVSVVALPFLDSGAHGAARLELIAGRAAAGIRGLLHGQPYYCAKYWSKGLSRSLCKAVTAAQPDVVLVEGMQMILYLRDLHRLRDQGRLDCRLCLGSDELSSLPRLRQINRTRNPLRKLALRHQASAWQRLQVQATHWADATMCVTDQDRDLLLADGGRNCHTVPLGIDTYAIKPVWAPEPPIRLLFVGSFSHRPNREAVKFLIDKVWPNVAKYAQDMEMVLAGRGSRDFLNAHGGGDRSIKAMGFVEDLTDLYRRCRLFVAPLTEGGGIKIKILEAMAYGIPVATTPLGAEGIMRAEDDALWIGEPDESFADTIRGMLDNRDETANRAIRARTIIEERFGWPALARRMSDLFSSTERG